jgi:aminoglycoside phosphotransferase (APT) family kinase protein
MGWSRDSVAGMTRVAADAEGADVMTQLTPETAHRALERSCAAAGLDAAGAELVRIGSNAVYRLAFPVVVRIAPSTAALEQAHTQVVVARWLAGERFPAVRVLEGVNQPIVIDDRVTTFWVSFAERDDYASIEDVARLIRRLHDLPSPEGFALPRLDVLGRAEQRLESVTGLSADDRTYLQRRITRDRDRYAKLDFELPAGVIHGDASIGNVMLDRASQPLMTDLDGFCTGPREWDLIITATYFDRFGWHTPEEYRRFVEIYGYDVMDWSGYPVLADLQELLMTIWLAGKPGADKETAAEVHMRIETMRSESSRHDWKPF